MLSLISLRGDFNTTQIFISLLPSSNLKTAAFCSDRCIIPVAIGSVSLSFLWWLRWWCLQERDIRYTDKDQDIFGINITWIMLLLPFFLFLPGGYRLFLVDGIDHMQASSTESFPFSTSLSLFTKSVCALWVSELYCIILKKTWVHHNTT